MFMTSTCFGNRGHLTVLNDTKLVLNGAWVTPNHLGSIWYHSEPADVPCSKNLLRPISWFGLFLQINDSSYLIVYVRTTGDPLSVTSRLKSLKISATKFEPQ